MARRIAPARVGAVGVMLLVAVVCLHQSAGGGDVALGEMSALQRRALALFVAAGHTNEYHNDQASLAKDEALQRALRSKQQAELHALAATSTLLAAAAHAAERKDAALQTGHGRDWMERRAQLRGDLQAVLRATASPCAAGTSDGPASGNDGPASGNDEPASGTRKLALTDCAVAADVRGGRGTLRGMEATPRGFAALRAAEWSTREAEKAVRGEEKASKRGDAKLREDLSTHRAWRNALPDAAPAFGQLLASYVPPGKERREVVREWAAGRGEAALERLEKLASRRDPWGLERTVQADK